jgi:membrane protease YdiL (CAAX protease family)
MARQGASYGESVRDQLSGRTGVGNPAVVLPTVAVALAETALFFGRTDLALWGHLLALLICVFGPLAVEDEPMLLAFTLVPVFRLVNLGMPVFVELTLFWFPLVYAPLFPAVYVVATNAETPQIRTNARFAAAALLPGAAIGALLAEIEYAIIRPDALIPVWNLPNLAFVAIVMFGFVGLVEELVYRGILQRALQRRVGRTGGLLVASFLFGMMHSAYGTSAEIAFASGIGLVFGLVYDATDSIVLVTVMHGTLNVFLFAVIPLRGSAVPF